MSVFIVCAMLLGSAGQDSRATQAHAEESKDKQESPAAGDREQETPSVLPGMGSVSTTLYTLNAPPPGFDGKAMPLLKPKKGMQGWTDIDGKATDWTIDEDGVVHATDRDVMTEMAFGDCQLHIEYSLPQTPGRIGSAAATSGVVIQGRYEIELHNSFGRPPSRMSAGAIRGAVAPIANASLPAPGWQALDVYFKAPLIEDGKVVRPAMMTALLNGVLILNNVEITAPTDAAIGTDMPAMGPLVLQGSPDQVHFRNIWIRRP